MNEEITNEHWKLAREVLVQEAAVQYMFNADVRRELTLKLLDRILAAESPKCDCGKAMLVRKVCKSCDNDD